MGAGAMVSQVKPSNCFRRSKISFTFHVWHKSFILHDVKLAELFWIKEVTIWRSKHTLTPVTYFQGVKTPAPRIYVPALITDWCSNSDGFQTGQILSSPFRRFDPDPSKTLCVTLKRTHRHTNISENITFFIFGSNCGLY